MTGPRVIGFGEIGRRAPMPARLRFFHGPMDCGKSTLALQISHNQARQGRRGLLLTRYDRSGEPRITTRVGLSREAIEVTPDVDIRGLVRAEWARRGRVDYLVVDEAGFLDEAHVEQLADLVDSWNVDVFCFGLSTDFRSRLLPGAKRLIELADEVSPVHVDVLCWCGQQARLNARIVNGRVVRDGDTVVVADTEHDSHGVHYRVLCRIHYRQGDLGPEQNVADQLSLDV